MSSVSIDTDASDITLSHLALEVVLQDGFVLVALCFELFKPTRNARLPGLHCLDPFVLFTREIAAGLLQRGEDLG